MNARAPLILLLFVLVAAAGCKKSEAAESDRGTDKGASTPTTGAAAGPSKGEAPATQETAWLKAKGTQDVTGGPATIKVPKGEVKKENKYGWSTSTGPTYFYKMSLEELRASMRHLIATGGFTIEDTKTIGSIEVLTVVAKDGAKLSVSTAEQIDSKLAFVGIKKGY